MDLIARILYDTVYHTTPILLLVLGGLFAYKAGVLNIALEGMMLAGAFLSILTALYTNNLLFIYLIPIIGCLFLGFVFAYLAVPKKGNVIVIGLAINMIVPAIAGFVLQIMGVPNLTVSWVDVSNFKINIPVLDSIPLIGDMLNHHPLITYLSFLLIIIVNIVVYKTKFGIYTRVVGENLDAAESLGINGNKFKILAVLVGAIFCAFAGVNLSFERLGIFTNNMTAGRGFIAIAAIYCGKGEPIKCTLYSIIFGLARALSINLSIYAGGVSALFDIIPYMLMVIILAINSAYQIRNLKMRTYW